ncbi:MAG: hypothetical protein AAGG02_00445 [Cyanobacteria bacterium P01_H01_bin.15]
MTRLSLLLIVAIAIFGIGPRAVNSQWGRAPKGFFKEAREAVESGETEKRLERTEKRVDNSKERVENTRELDDVEDARDNREEKQEDGTLEERHERREKFL